LPVTGTLGQRTLTALALGPLVLAAVVWLPTGWLALALALVVLLGAWEWMALAGVTNPLARLGYLGVVALGFAALWQVHLAGWGPYFLAPVVLCWIGFALYLAGVAEISRAEGVDLRLLAVGLPVLLGPWLALLDLDAMRPDGPLLVLSLLLLIWAADIAAYFAGRRWGRVKLAPLLSPGKTRAGGYAALAAAAACGLVLSWWLRVGLGQGLALVLICVVTVVASVAGDLFESLLKRRRGLKDSGRLLPGHGGMLDRIDSMTAAAPVFTLGLQMLL
jgi:phosphatidate cytidylyltransferase